MSFRIDVGPPGALAWVNGDFQVAAPPVKGGDDDRLRSVADDDEGGRRALESELTARSGRQSRQRAGPGGRCGHARSARSGQWRCSARHLASAPTAVRCRPRRRFRGLPSGVDDRHVRRLWAWGLAPVRPLALRANFSAPWCRWWRKAGAAPSTAVGRAGAGIDLSRPGSRLRVPVAAATAWRTQVRRWRRGSSTARSATQVGGRSRPGAGPVRWEGCLLGGLAGPGAHHCGAGRR